jgi:hypothetical protein
MSVKIIFLFATLLCVSFTVESDRNPYTQVDIFQFLTKNTFYFGSSESDYNDKSTVRFKPEMTGTMQMGGMEITFSNSSKQITGMFKVTNEDRVVLEDVRIYNPYSEGTDEMSGRITIVSSRVLKLVLRAEDAPSKTFYLIKK